MNKVRILAIQCLLVMFLQCGPSALDQALTLLKQIDAEVVSSTETLKHINDLVEKGKNFCIASIESGLFEKMLSTAKE